MPSIIMTIKQPSRLPWALKKFNESSRRSA